MPRFAANLSMMFNELPLLERFRAAAAAGFGAVEFLFPYEHPAEVVAGALRAAGLRQVLFNLPPGDWARGERGLAALPDRSADFRASVATALDYARALDVPSLHVMAGLAPATDPAAAAAYLDALR
ncbi:TIM barrel protein, partial [Rhizobium sp. TRM95111]|uniref:TIM barrel protein n=1 Tax=Rhizobium alarense TaxID=2846851 RepID=UPI001F271D00